MLTNALLYLSLVIIMTSNFDFKNWNMRRKVAKNEVIIRSWGVWLKNAFILWRPVKVGYNDDFIFLSTQV